MDYQKIYNILISKAKGRCQVDGEYYERHHIIPRSMEGSNLKENIVLLTAKEHYVAHHLLWRIHKIPPMAHAFWMMSTTRLNNSRFKISAVSYAIARKAAVESMIKKMSDPGVKEAIRRGLLGHPVSDETRRKISFALKGRPADPNVVARRSNSNRGKRKGKTWEELFGHEVALKMKDHFRSLYSGRTLSEDHRKNISKGLQGRLVSTSVREKISKANQGRKRSNESRLRMSQSKIGRTMDEDTKEKISKSLTGSSKSDHTRALISEARKGMCFTNEHKMKLSQSHKGLIQSDETKKKRSESLKKYHASKKSKI
jgi:hypothetical protein